MSDLTEFLKARLDEDVAVAEGGDQRSPDMTYRLDERLEWVSVTPARVLAEVESKRRIIAEAFAYAAKIDSEWGCCHSADRIEAGECPDTDPDEIDLLRLLALPYASHEAYRPEWIAS